MEELGHLFLLDHVYDEDINVLYIFLFWTGVMVQFQGWKIKTKQAVFYKIYEKV